MGLKNVAGCLFLGLCGVDEPKLLTDNLKGACRASTVANVYQSVSSFANAGTAVTGANLVAEHPVVAIAHAEDANKAYKNLVALLGGFSLSSPDGAIVHTVNYTPASQIVVVCDK